MNGKKILVVACSLSLFGAGTAQADVVSDLQAQMEALQKQLDQVKTQLYNMQQEQKKEKEEALKPGGPFLRVKPDSGATFLVPGGGEVSLYGNLDVSFDETTKGLKSDYGDNGGTPVGKWMAAGDPTNLSYLGIRGTHPVQPRLEFHLATLRPASTLPRRPGSRRRPRTPATPSTARCFRGTASGFAGKEWGAVMIGKSETPYKTSTDRLNPFSGMLGDYRVMIGNTGGDNRVEFGLRASHALWYESANWGGASFKAMYSPGQNRDDTSSIVPSSEPDCAGGNIPGSGHYLDLQRWLVWRPP